MKHDDVTLSSGELRIAFLHCFFPFLRLSLQCIATAGSVHDLSFVLLRAVASCKARGHHGFVLTREVKRFNVQICKNARSKLGQL